MNILEEMYESNLFNPATTDDMMLGQHLYIEVDYGQGEVKSGLNLPSYYIIEEEGNYYVWKKVEDDRIQKTLVTVGDYDEDMDTWEIKDGITLDDYIAYPEDGIEDGLKTTTNYEDIIEQESDTDSDSDEFIDDTGVASETDGLVGPIIDDEFDMEDDGLMPEDDGAAQSAGDFGMPESE